MLDINWVLFILASVAVILTPGQDLVLVLSRSLTQGAGAGIVTAAGVSTGLMLHTVLATLGVGAIVMASEWLYLTMKYVGAGYLIYLGLCLWRESNTVLQAGTAKTRSVVRLFFDGAFSNIANPKIAIFFLAFLPQFVGVDSTSPTTATFILGSGFALLTFVIKAPLGYYAGHLSGWFATHPTYLKFVYRTSGSVLLMLGANLVLNERV